MELPTTQEPQIGFHLLTPDGPYPNNSELPLLIYAKALSQANVNGDKAIVQLFEKNGWANSWTNGIYDYHHFHSTTHEVLGIAAGEATVQFGGTDGIVEKIRKGDVIIIPAGVAHKCVHSTEDFSVVGAYPNGQDYDLQTGDEGDDRPIGFQNNVNVPLPEKDPVFGDGGPLLQYWANDVQGNASTNV